MPVTPETFFGVKKIVPEKECGLIAALLHSQEQSPGHSRKAIP
jgi:hypothetical protein